MDGLKPCPFCGSKNLSTALSKMDGMIRCGCGVVMRFGSEPERFEHVTGYIYRKIPAKTASQIAIEHWNRRAGEDG